MNKVIKGLAYTVGAIAGLLLLLVVVLVVFVDPNDYKGDIETIARDAGGVELTLGGDLSWRFYPVLGFGAEKVTLAMQPDTPTLVDIGELKLGVKLLPLFSKKIEVDEISISGLNANLRVDVNGNNNWSVPEGEQTIDDSENTKPSATAPDIKIPRISVNDSTIVYSDKQSGTDYRVALEQLVLENVALNQAFPLTLKAAISDAAGLQVDTTLNSLVKVDLDNQQYQLNDLDLVADIKGVFEKTAPLTVKGNVVVDQKKDNAIVNISSLSLANAEANLAAEATGLSGELAYKGQLNSKTFDAKKLMAALGVPAIETQDGSVLSKVNVAATFSGTPKKAAVNPLTIVLDDSTLSGQVTVSDLQTQSLSFALGLDKIDLDRYMAPVSETAEKPATTSDANAELIPVETLRGLNLQGTFKATEVVINKIPMTNINVAVKAKDGVLTVSDIKANLLKGDMGGTVTVNAKGAEPAIATDLGLNKIEMAELLKPFTTQTLFSGISSFTLNTKTTGNTVDTLIKQALGKATLSMDDSVIHGVNINEVALGAVKNKLGDFSQLYPDYQQKLPKALKSDTEIKNLLANINIENGHLIMPQVSADTNQGNFSASGDIDLLNKGFDYTFGVQLSALAGNKYLKGTQWPIVCKGGVGISVLNWCRPDSSAINKVFERAAKKALQEKGAEKLGEKLGVTAGEGETAKEALQEKAKEEEQRAKDKVNEKINEKLNKLFGK